MIRLAVRERGACIGTAHAGRCAPRSSRRVPPAPPRHRPRRRTLGAMGNPLRCDRTDMGPAIVFHVNPRRRRSRWLCTRVNPRLGRHRRERALPQRYPRRPQCRWAALFRSQDLPFPIRQSTALSTSSADRSSTTTPWLLRSDSTHYEVMPCGYVEEVVDKWARETGPGLGMVLLALGMHSGNGVASLRSTISAKPTSSPGSVGDRTGWAFSMSRG
jgi:hypothetical protein